MEPGAYIYWDVSPEIFRIGGFALRWYSLLFALSFFIGLQIITWIFKKENKPVKDLDQLFILVLAGTIVGARLGHCLFYDPGYYLTHPLEIIKIWRGGLASHGGAIGILIAMYLYAKNRKDQPYLWVLDRVVVPVALAGAFIRLGNLFNSEIIGTRTDVSWAFIFARVDQLPRHPTQLYESIIYAIIFIALLSVFKQKSPNIPHGYLLGLFLVTIFGSRFFVEFVKVRQEAYGELFPLTTGQWLSIPAVIAGVWLIARARTEDKDVQKKKVR
ncbi:MAG: prolipoprotein diacylglyceryl transferase [bacterium]